MGTARTLHRIKGWIVRILGRATADRHVEAEGLAEERAGRHPTDSELAAAEHDVKARQTGIVETTDDERRGGDAAGP